MSIGLKTRQRLGKGEGGFCSNHSSSFFILQNTSKSTILHALRGTLPLLKGDRTENDQLRLGVFTQDLAQELDGEARAVDVVTQHARKDFDITISDEQARGVLGRLGLQGEKSLRQIKNLSGGEKARV